jgi:hypothetical protein
MTKHSPEPWVYLIESPNETLMDANDETILVADNYKTNDMYRIVACINACAGIPTEMIKHIVYVGLITLNDSATTPEQWLTKALEMREKE